jgi:hypothetical protein
MCQQSPTCGNPFTSATSQHHFVTPTSRRRAPTAHKIDVALGASETIRNSVVDSLGFVMREDENTRGSRSAMPAIAAVYGLGAGDVTTFAGITLLMAAITALACYVPTCKALSVDPIVALSPRIARSRSSVVRCYTRADV